MISPKNFKGTQLGRYTLLEHLASGGMAEIFLARQKAEAGFSKELVLKVLQPRWEEHPEVVDLFMGEARIAALMNHPNVVEVFDVAYEKGAHFIAMEYIRGKMLTELAKRAIEVTKEIPLDFGVYVAAEVASALSHIYDGLGKDGRPFRVVHRDISPTNILVGAAGEVKLIDFGIARQGIDVDKGSNLRPGKVTYMSPEQVQGAPIDGRSDIFCLGTILYEITLGKRLWRGPRETAVRRIVEERPKPPTFVRRDYPPELELIVLRALEKRPGDRYQSPSEFHQVLQNFLMEPGMRLRNKYQMSLFVEKIFSQASQALVSEVALQKAKAFFEGDESADADYDPLDFDRPLADGPGAALARAMRAAAVPAAIKAEAHVPPSVITSDRPKPLVPTRPAKPISPTPPPKQTTGPLRAVVSTAVPVASTAKTNGKAGKKTGNGPGKDKGGKPKALIAANAADAAKNAGGKQPIVTGEPNRPASDLKTEDESERLPRKWVGAVVFLLILALIAFALFWFLS
jgi:serine/threonine-protein kinase